MVLLATMANCEKNNDENSMLAALGLINNSQDSGEVKITFHDTPIDGNTIARIDMNVVRTELIDFDENSIVVSDEAHSFNLLDLTANNPVALAHASVPARTYKQIRLILDSNSSVTLNDGSSHSLKVPSGEQTGLKIDGVFTIPEGKLYTLDIDMDPGKSVHYTKGQGYMLKPVITLLGEDLLQGPFYFGGEVQGKDWVMQVNSNGTIQAKLEEYQDYLLHGKYKYDGINRIFTVGFEKAECLQYCNDVQDLFGSNFVEGLNASYDYNMVEWGKDYITISPIGIDVEGTLHRVNSFNFQSPEPKTALVFNVHFSDPNLAGKILFSRIFYDNVAGEVKYAKATIDENGKAVVVARVPISSFQNTSENYKTLLIVVNDMSDIKLRPDLTLAGLTNIIWDNTAELPVVQVNSGNSVNSYTLDY